MSQITFAVNYPESFRRGMSCQLPPTVTLDVEPSTLSPEDREWIARRLRHDGAIASLKETGYWDSTRLSNETDRDEKGVMKITADEPTVAGVLAAIRAEDDAAATYQTRMKAAAQAKAESDRSESLANLRGEPHRQTVSVRVNLLSDGGIRLSDFGHTDDIGFERVSYEREYIYNHYVTGLAESEVSELKSRSKLLDAETDSRCDAAVAEAKARLLAQYWQPRLDWISAHGSARLKRLAAEGIGHGKTYQSERAKYEAEHLGAAIAAERPGWYAMSESDLQTEVADVSLRTLALLDAARLLAPTAKLGKLKSSGKYVAYESFRGAMIVWPKE